MCVRCKSNVFEYFQIRFIVITAAVWCYEIESVMVPRFVYPCIIIFIYKYFGKLNMSLL